MVKRSSNKKDRDVKLTMPHGGKKGPWDATLGNMQSGEVKHPESRKNPHAVALGSLGGKKGGPARAMRLTPARRSEIARLAAEARWRKQI